MRRHCMMIDIDHCTNRIFAIRIILSNGDGFFLRRWEENRHSFLESTEMSLVKVAGRISQRRIDISTKEPRPRIIVSRRKYLFSRGKNKRRWIETIFPFPPPPLPNSIFEQSCYQAKLDKRFRSAVRRDFLIRAFHSSSIFVSSEFRREELPRKNLITTRLIVHGNKP